MASPPPSPSLLAQPAVRRLLTQGAHEGRVSYAQINDLLIDLELDESDVEFLFDTLEKRAIIVVDEDSSGAPTQQTQSQAPRSFKTKTGANAGAGSPHDDLDAILSDLNALSSESDVDSVAQFLAEVESEEEIEELYVGEDLDDSQAPVTDALKLYLNRMGAVPRLTPEAEKELALVARTGSSEAALEAKNQLVEANLRLVVHLAHTAAPRTTLSLTDLLQEGNLGLLDAVERYRPDSNKTFGAYATWWVRRSMNRAINEHSRIMRLSGELYTAIQKMQSAQRELAQTLGRAPSREEIAVATGLSTAQIEEAQRAASRPVSLDAPIGSGDEMSEMGDQFADPESEVVGEAAARREMREGLARLFEDLTEREQAVVSMRFGLADAAAQGPQSAEDVAKALNLSRERVHELETRALRKLRKKAKGAGLDQLLG